jgi:DNA-directed RNA polymerase specialized sigma24 family protein
VGLLSFFRRFGGWIKKAFRLAEDRGLNDSLIQEALEYVQEAVGRFDTTAKRRTWVIGILTKKGLPESIARLALELAVQLFKRRG